MLLTEKIDGPRLLLLGGRSWRVTWIDWNRRRCYVEPAEDGGKARWLTPASREPASRYRVPPGTSCSGRTAGGPDPAGQADPGRRPQEHLPPYIRQEP